uniref:Uncharacterized protein n=1 Tax=Anguilla anguilla TaxID=7936 RepID=A0A0E9SFQ5_ANGAN
MYSKCSAG